MLWRALPASARQVPGVGREDAIATATRLRACPRGGIGGNNGDVMGQALVLRHLEEMQRKATRNHEKRQVLYLADKLFPCSERASPRIGATTSLGHGTRGNFLGCQTAAARLGPWHWRRIPAGKEAGYLRKHRPIRYQGGEKEGVSYTMYNGKGRKGGDRIPPPLHLS